MTDNKSKGIAYGVGVGPGDPELMTLKSCRLIRENDVVAVPGKDPKKSAAYRIAVQVVPELAEKEMIAIEMPMVTDEKVMEESHKRAADVIAAYLDDGRNVVYLTIGDPTVYCTFSYIQHILAQRGYESELINGVPSFCAAAARLGISLVEGRELLHIIPGVYNTKEEALSWPGNYAIMKSGGKLAEVKQMLASSERDVVAVENCGKEEESVYRSLDEIPDDAGYFTMVIAKGK